MGTSSGAALARRPAAIIEGNPDGARSADDQVFATYAHGVFDRPEARAALLAWAGFSGGRGVDLDALREAALERLADHLEEELDLRRMLGALLPDRCENAP
jgi:adenosylcobyric acid synthase